MGDSLFDIFGDHISRQANNTVARQPLSNDENVGKGKMGVIAPMKTKEPLQMAPKKQIEPKKSFLSNAGKAIQNTPIRAPFTPRAVNVGSLIYNDNAKDCDDIIFEEIEFTKPSSKYDKYLDYDFDDICYLSQSPPGTPPPTMKNNSMELDCSYQDEFFIDDFSNEAFPDDEDDLPDIF